MHKFPSRFALLSPFYEPELTQPRNDAVYRAGGIGVVPLFGARRAALHFIPFTYESASFADLGRPSDKVWQLELAHAPSMPTTPHWCCLVLGKKPSLDVRCAADALLAELIGGGLELVARFDRGPERLRVLSATFARRAHYQCGVVGVCELVRLPT